MTTVLSIGQDRAGLMPGGRRRRRPAARAGAGAALVLVGLLAAACGSGTASTTTTTSGSASSPAAAASGSAFVVKTAKIASLGTVLVDSKGMTLYHYTLDHPPKIACTGGCASIWPPLLVPSGAHVMGPKGVGTMKRPGGTTQVTYKGLPLYTYVGDKSPGQAAGQGYTHTWYVLRIGAAPAAGGSTTSTTSGSSGGY
jgi:predicted lipoprotein with Yx(FWY)xxD motif